MSAFIRDTAEIRGNALLMQEASRVVCAISRKIFWFNKPIHVQDKFVIHMLRKNLLNDC